MSCCSFDKLKIPALVCSQSRQQGSGNRSDGGEESWRKHKKRVRGWFSFREVESVIRLNNYMLGNTGV